MDDLKYMNSFTQDACVLRANADLGGLGLGHFLKQGPHEQGQLLPPSRQLLVHVAGAGVLTPAHALRQDHLDLVLERKVS